MGVCEKKENGSMVERESAAVGTDWLLWTETAASMTEVYKKTN